MNRTDLSLQSEDKKIITELLENVYEVIKDSDAVEEKTSIKNFLCKASEYITFTVLGKSGVGKSTFLNKLFKDKLYAQQETEATVGINEIRYGAEEAVISLDKDVHRIFKPVDELQGFSIVDMQGAERLLHTETVSFIKKYMSQSDVLFVVFQAGRVNDHDVWDLLEQTAAKNVIFILTKCDTASPEDVTRSKEKVSTYMSDIGISAPVFTISSYWEQEEVYSKSGFDILREYIGNNIIGKNPILTKQWKDVADLKNVLQQWNASFELRKKQYEADALVLKNIDTLMDAFTINSVGMIKNLKETLANEIEAEVDQFQDEVIKKLNPAYIKEHFPRGSTDFIDYMNFINEVYKKKMTESVTQKTQQAVRRYLSDLENVFEEATGYFRTRESLLKLEDRFYGTLSVTKNSMVSQSMHTLEHTRAYYTSLTEASQELFMQMWDAREKYEKKVTASTIRGAASGAVLGGGSPIAGIAGYGLLAEKGVKAVFAATTIGAWASIVVVSALVGSVLISEMAKKISTAKNMREMEKRTQECIDAFKKEVNHTKQGMIDEILQTIDSIFRRELETADKSFVEFRMSVNIDSKNIPAIEERICKIQGLMCKVEEMERKAFENEAKDKTVAGIC